VIPKSLAASVAVLCSAATLSGCYIVPIDSRYPVVPGQFPVVNQTAGSPVAMSAPQSVPVNLQARLYPLNETAGKMGALTASVTDSVNGHATFSVNQGGELLQGEATRVATGYPGFGRVHREVYGDGRMPSGQRGIASATGTRGTYVNCEYALTDSNRGTGACMFSNGATYQLHFGS
jgi:hypothetical protein